MKGNKKKGKNAVDITVNVEGSMISMRLDRALATRLPGWSRAGIDLLINSGGVKLNGKMVKKGSMRLKSGDELSIDSNIHEELMKSREYARSVEDFAHTGDASAVIPEDIPIDIVYEDDDVLVVDKPVGMVIHPAYAHTVGTLANAVAGYFKKKGIPLFRRVGLVNRLDKDVSGLVLFAKNEFSLGILSKQFSGEGIEPGAPEPPGKARKLYWAVVGPATQKKMSEAGIGVKGKWVRVDGYMHRSRGDRRKHTFSRNSIVAEDTGVRYALSYVRQVKVIGKGYYLSEIRIVTGRTHQIRAQMSKLGLPIVGDVMYGGEKYQADSGIRLRCIKVSFIPPEAYRELYGEEKWGKGDIYKKSVGKSFLGEKMRIDKKVDRMRKIVERREIP